MGIPLNEKCRSNMVFNAHSVSNLIVVSFVQNDGVGSLRPHAAHTMILIWGNVVTLTKNMKL